MGFSASDVVPFTQARSHLSELAEQVKAGAEKIITKNGESYVALNTKPEKACEFCAFLDQLVGGLSRRAEVML